MSENRTNVAQQQLRLPIVASPKSGESFIGFVLRLTESNRYDRPSWILKLNSDRAYSLQLGYLHSRIPSIARITGVTENKLREMCPSSGIGKGITIVPGNEISTHFFDLQNPKVCPQCIEEYGQTFACWDLRVFQCCHVHGTLLVEYCPDCTQKITWARNRLNRCLCGVSYQRGELWSGNENLVWLSELIARKLDGPKSEGRGDWKFAPWDTQGVQEIFAHMDAFISYLAHYTGHYHYGIYSKLSSWTRVDLLDLVTRVVSMMRDWPRSFHQIIGDVATEKFNWRYPMSALNHNPLLKRFYKLVTEHKSAVSLSLLKDELRAVAEKEGSIIFVTLRGRSHFCRRLEVGQRYMTKGDVKRRLSISSETFFRLVRRGVLDASISEVGKQHIHKVTKLSVRKYEVVRSSYLSKADLAKALGVSRPFVEKLIAAGLVPAIEGPAIDGAQKWQFEPGAKQGFVDAIASNCEPIVLPESMLVSFSRLYDYMSRTGVSWDRFVNAVQDGVLKSRKVDPAVSTLCKFRYCIWELPYLSRLLLEETYEAEISKGRLKYLLGIQPQALSEFMREIDRESCKECYVELQSLPLTKLIAFIQNYVPRKFLP